MIRSRASARLVAVHKSRFGKACLSFKNVVATEPMAVRFFSKNFFLGNFSSKISTPTNFYTTRPPILIYPLPSTRPLRRPPARAGGSAGPAGSRPGRRRGPGSSLGRAGRAPRAGGALRFPAQVGPLLLPTRPTVRKRVRTKTPPELARESSLCIE